MRIGINASFLRKQGTGIGQANIEFLRQLALFQGQSQSQNSTAGQGHLEFFLYCEEKPVLPFALPKNFSVRTFLPLWKRDDLIRKMLWESKLKGEAFKDGCDTFLSLYQASTIFPKSIHHVMVVHDLIPHFFPSYQGNLRQKIHWQLVERGIRNATAFIVVSQSTKHDLIRFGIKEADIEIAYPAVGPRFALPPTGSDEKRILEKYALIPGYIYHGGGLEVRKNTERLLCAYKRLREEAVAGTLLVPLPPLVISGKIFSEKNILATPVRALVKKLGLEDTVKLLDFVPEEDLPTLYKNAIFFAYPSLYEGYGLPVQEALSCGTPVLTGNNSSLPEIVGDAGLLVDAENFESISSGIKRLLSDADLRTGFQSIAKASSHRYSWEAFTKTVLQSLRITV